MANDLRFRRISIPDFIHYILILQKEPAFHFLMLSAKQGNCGNHFYNSFGMTLSLTGDWIGTSRTQCQHSTTMLSRRRYRKVSDCLSLTRSIFVLLTPLKQCIYLKWPLKFLNNLNHISHSHLLMSSWLKHYWSFPFFVNGDRHIFPHKNARGLNDFFI